MARLEKNNPFAGRDDVAGKVALGATGVVLAAGAVAAASALASKTTRQKVQKGVRTVRKAVEEGVGRYKTFQHRIGVGKGLMKKSAHGGKRRRKG